jgi:hypothetical protein
MSEHFSKLDSCAKLAYNIWMWVCSAASNVALLWEGKLQVVICPKLWDPSPPTIEKRSFAASETAPTKEWWNYWDHHLVDQFLPLAIQIFSCLHKQVDDFLQVCTNNVWGMKDSGGPPLSILSTYFRQRVSIALQKLQAPTILSQALVVGLTTSWLPPLTDPLSITTSNIWFIVGTWRMSIRFDLQHGMYLPTSVRQQTMSSSPPFSRGVSLFFVFPCFSLK